MKRLSTHDLKRLAWHKGDLSYLLFKGARGQRSVRDAFYAADTLTYVFCCARRYGKSTIACALSLEACLRQPNAQVRYAAPTKDAVKKIVRPIISRLLEDCPEELKPKYYKNDGMYVFPNGSQLHVAGAEAGNAEKLRGTETHFAVVDEAGFIDESSGGQDLESLIDDVLMPQTITTGGRILVISTPAKSAAHAFHMKYALRAEAEGHYTHRTIYDATHIDDATRARYMDEAGGEDSPTWQREYLARVIVDATVAVVPEFGPKEPEIVVPPPHRPEFFDAYVAADFGYHDLTAILFAYYNFPLGKIVVEDELVFLKTNSGAIAQAIKDKELELWGHQAPEFRVADVHMRLIRDLSDDHGIIFRQCRKDDREAALNQLRLHIADSKIVISPRCKHTIAHLKGAVWNKSRTDFARSGQYGHFDCVDAMVYLVRHINKGSNPYPLGRGLSHSTHFIQERPANAADPLRKLMQPKKRGRR